MFVCPICHNSNPIYIGIRNGTYYCRKCIMFSRGKKVNNKTYKVNDIKANLKYSLTKTQDKASNEILSYVSNGKSCIVNAVCGAGKTELVYRSIEYFINKGLKVGFTIPRVDVVKEIYMRLKNDYPKIRMSLVYGSHTNNLDGQLVCLTTHQLFRYNHYFDLLILDEADAFPYYQNDLLEVFLNNSCKGTIIYLSATIKECYQKVCSNVVYVNRRFHNYDLPVPVCIRYNQFNKINILNETIKKLSNKQILIFVPTIDIGFELSKITKIPFIYSSSIDKELYINKFRKNEIRLLITTSILERGITFLDVQVIVYETNHKLFDESTLIQISGRVGRKIKAPTGTVYFLSTSISDEMKKCIETIKNKNESGI